MGLLGHRIIDKDEFKKVMTWMREQTRVGKSHAHGLRTGMQVSGDVEDAGLVELFFGDDGKRGLPRTQFEKFLRDLHKEVLNSCIMRTSVFPAYRLKEYSISTFVNQYVIVLDSCNRLLVSSLPITTLRIGGASQLQILVCRWQPLQT